MDKDILKNYPDLIKAVSDLLLFILSWLVLTAISIIVCGKFAAKVFPVGFLDDDEFSINLFIIKIKARGDEVSLGFGIFIIFLVISVIFGGERAYELFKIKSGIDVGQWNSLCMIASSMCLIFTFLFYVVFRISKPISIVNKVERDDLIRRLEEDAR